jgi:hypothetical protein
MNKPAGLLLLLLSTPAMAQAPVPEVGVAASVVPRVTGEPPGRTLRSLEVGIDVLRNERVATGPQGRAQMLFRDGSALTVGPDSEVVLDEYVYDPNTGAGRMAASVGKGVLRLVGGQLSKRDPVTLRTPTATIGIRGGVALYDNGLVTFLFGQSLTIDSSGPGGQPQRLELRRPGTAVSIGGDGSIGAPTPVNTAAMGGTLARLEGVSGSGGGASETPTDQRVAATQVPVLGSANPPAAVAPRGAELSFDLAAAAATELAESTVQLGDASQNQAVQSQTSDFTGAVFTAVGLRQPPFSNSGIGLANFSVSPKNPSNFDRGGTGFAGSGTLFLTFPNGNGNLTFGSGFFSASGATSTGGSASGVGFVSPSRDFFFYSLKESGTNIPAFIAGGVPIQGFAAPTSGLTFLSHRLVPGFPDQTLIPTLPASLNGNLPGASISPLLSVLTPSLYAAGSGGLPADTRSQYMWAALAIDGQGIGQKSAFLLSTGRYYVDNNANNPTFGKLVAAGTQNGNLRFGTEVSPTGNGQLFRVEQGAATLFDGSGTGFFGSPDSTYFTLASDIYNVAPPHDFLNGVGGAQNRSDALVSTTFPFYSTAPALPQMLPPGIGASRTARTLNGYAGGIYEVSQYCGTTFTGVNFMPALVKNNDPANLTITTDPTLNRLTATFKMNLTQLPPMFNFDVNVEFGDLNGQLNTRSAFIDDNVFAARESELRQNSFGSTPFNFSKNILVTSDVVKPTSILPSGVSYCACQ